MAREILSATDSRSYQHIWARFTHVSKPDETSNRDGVDDYWRALHFAALMA
jgi:hypothetical protein